MRGGPPAKTAHLAVRVSYVSVSVSVSVSVRVSVGVSASARGQCEGRATAHLAVRDLDLLLDQLLLGRFVFGFLTLHVEEGESVLELLEVHLRGDGRRIS